MKQKKILALLLAGAMTMSATAMTVCAEATSPDNDLVISIEGTVMSMDPQNISDTNAISATRGIYEELIHFDENQELEGVLAESWEVSEDSLTYTFHLRQGVKFHDGTDFNAAAVVANYDRVFNADNALKSRRTYFKTDAEGNETPRIASIETPDDYTVVFTLSEPYGVFINKLTQMCFISPAAIEEYGNDVMYHPCGTGPYVYGEWVEGDHVTMTRNDEYWGEKPGVDSVTIKEVPEAGTRTAMFQTGESDLVYPLAADQRPVIEGTEGAEILTSVSNIMRYVTLNTNVEALSDVRVRQAMNYAIDKDAYVALMYGGYGEAATSTVPSVIQYYKEQTPYTFDLEKAKALMEEAGYADGFDLTIWGDNTTQEIKGMTFIQQQLAQIGINVEVVPMEPATVSEKIYVPLEDAEINMWYVNWSASDFSADSSMRALLYSSMCPPTSANTVYYNNPDFDKAMDDGLAAATEEEKAAFYQTAQELAWNDATWLFLGTDQIVYASQPYLDGVYVAPDGAIRYQEASLAQ